MDCILYVSVIKSPVYTKQTVGISYNPFVQLCVFSGKKKNSVKVNSDQYTERGRKWSSDYDKKRGNHPLEIN